MHIIMLVFYIQDGLRLTIQFSSQEGEYELDADTQEDKNSVCILYMYSTMYAIVLSMGPLL
jgi:hypothetical protein